MSNFTVIRRGAGGARNVNKRFVEIDAAINGGVKQPPTAAAANITTAGAGSLLVASLKAGVITRDPAGGDRTDTTDTAANIIAAAGLNLTKNYQEKQVLIVNTADAAETITLAGGTGVTIKGTITIEQNCAVRIAILRTGSASVCIRQV
jgi:hypothetical protein